MSLSDLGRSKKDARVSRASTGALAHNTAVALERTDWACFHQRPGGVVLCTRLSTTVDLLS